MQNWKNITSELKDIIKIGDSVKGVAREKADGSSTLLEIEKSKMSKAIKEAPSKWVPILYFASIRAFPIYAYAQQNIRARRMTAVNIGLANVDR